MEFFYAATMITIGDGKMANFWHTPWLQGRKPKEIAPSIFAISKRKNFTVWEGLQQDFWINKLDSHKFSTPNHIGEFIELWALVNEINLDEDTKDDIKWKFTANGEYSAASAYSAQFEGMVNSLMMEAVWNSWAPPKCKLFAWLILQNRVWSADRLQKRGWPNYGNCQLCKRVPETAAHILFKCRYSLRIWNSIIHWLGITSVNTATWANHDSVKEWWMSFIYSNGMRRKSLVTLIMLVSWEILNERNARVFWNIAMLPNVVVEKIRGEAALWSLAGAKNLSSILPRDKGIDNRARQLSTPEAR
jgi:hypothetical protein